MKDIECVEAQEACTAEREQAQERLQEVKNTLWKDISWQVRSYSLGKGSHPRASGLSQVESTALAG